MSDIRICFVGNSHLASLKLAVTQALFDCAGIEPTFWGAPDGRFKAVIASDGRLRPPEGTEDSFLLVSEGRCAEVDPSDFDFVVLHGIDLDMTSLLHGFARSSTMTDMSPRFLKEAFATWLTSRRAFVMAKELAASGTPILLSHCPLHDESSEGFDGLEVTAQTRNSVFEAIAGVARDEGLTFIAQPDATVRDNKYTAREYSIGSVKLGGPGELREHIRKEHKHMNPQYGALMLGKIVSVAKEINAARLRRQATLKEILAAPAAEEAPSAEESVVEELGSGSKTRSAPKKARINGKAASESDSGRMRRRAKKEMLAVPPAESAAEKPNPRSKSRLASKKARTSKPSSPKA